MDLSYKYFSYLQCASLWGAVSSRTEKRGTDKWLKGIPQRIRESSGAEMGMCTAWVGVRGWTREWGGGVLGATLGGQLQMASNTREQFGLHSVDGKEPMQLCEWQNEKTKTVLILVWVPPKAVPKRQGFECEWFERWSQEAPVGEWTSETGKGGRQEREC